MTQAVYAGLYAEPHSQKVAGLSVATRTVESVNFVDTAGNAGTVVEHAVGGDFVDLAMVQTAHCCEKGSRSRIAERTGSVMGEGAADMIVGGVVVEIAQTR